MKLLARAFYIDINSSINTIEKISNNYKQSPGNFLLNFEREIDSLLNFNNNY